MAGAILVALGLAVGQAGATTPGAVIDESSLALQAAYFAEPLTPTTETSAEEDAALATAITAWHAAPTQDDASALETWLADHPRSGWRLAIETNLGLFYYRHGYFSKAIAAFDAAWSDGSTATEMHAKALADRALGELLLMHARLGHADTLAALLDSTQGRGAMGDAFAARRGATEGLWSMRNEPGVSFLCGPMALENLLLAGGANRKQVAFLDDVRSGPRGTTLAEVDRLATRAGLAHRLVYRTPGQPVPVPSVVHWKLDHFAAIVAERDGRYELADPTFGHPHLWVTRAALDAEATGYFLVPHTAAAGAWREASEAEAEQVHGMGTTGAPDTTAFQPTDKTSGGDGSDGVNCGCARYSFLDMLASLRLTDTPVGYAPPVGPAMHMTLTYNQMASGEPANPTFSNVGPNWSFSWLGYVEDDPQTLGGNVTRHVAGGGSVVESGYNGQSFTPEVDDGSILTLTSTGPIRYVRSLRDGSLEVYAATNDPQGQTTDRRVFLTQIIDRFGNAATLNYTFKPGGQVVLLSVTDAVGQTTNFQYKNSSYPFQITRITDPFGRFAQLTYDSLGRLSSIQDVLNLTSSFGYDPNNPNNVSSLTTPYGTTNFSYPVLSSPQGYANGVQATDPLGNTEQLETWGGGGNNYQTQDTAPSCNSRPGCMTFDPNNLGVRNTYYWDKNAYQAAMLPNNKLNYNQARVEHWAHLYGATTATTSNTLESLKYPLESRIWYQYENQTDTSASGTYNQPTVIARLLDDGTTQLTTIQYNAVGNPILIEDPFGRTTQINYSSNGIDVANVKQGSGGSAATPIAGFGAYTNHQPASSIDAAGQTTRYTYNSFGQISQVTDPLGNTTTTNHNSAGFLTSIVDANSATLASFTPDTSVPWRVGTSTDSLGWTTTYTYDAMDRLRGESYPDGTSRVINYDPAHPLDVLSVTDRQGRTTKYAHDNDRNLVGTTDPAGDVTSYLYWPNGALATLTDPNGNATNWKVDLESRVYQKIFANGTAYQFSYGQNSGWLTAVVDPKRRTKGYTYWPDGQIKTKTYSDGTPTVSFIYDQVFPRLTSMTDGFGVTNYTYYPPGQLGALRLAQETPPFVNSAIAYTYDKLGRPQTRSVGGDSETFGYDAIGRLQTHIDDLGTFNLAYLGETGKPVSRLTAGTQLGTQWTYNGGFTNEHRLSTIGNAGASQFAYTILPEGDVHSLGETATPHPTNWVYGYDLADRLLTVSHSAGGTVVYGYTPDAAGNLTKIQNGSASVSIVPTVTNAVGAAANIAFSYDANGNLMQDATRSYTWDAEDRLTGIMALNGSYTTMFGYDGLGRRVVVNDTGSVTHLGWCGQTLCQKRDGNDTPLRRYFAEGEADATQGGLLYSVDHLGSARDILASGTGATIGHFDYTPYGVPSTTPPASTMPSWPDRRYAGLFYHQPSGLYLATNRAYDPALGRWLSRDPIGERGGVNLYGYVGGRPIDLIDPLGLCGGPSILGQISAAFSNPWLLALVIGTEIVGGGPENPIADALAAGEIAEFGGAAAEEAEEMVTLYRGVDAAHPGFANALEGTAIPRGGNASVLEHVFGGNTESEFTSWTTDFSTAESFATKESGSGAVLSNSFPRSSLIPSPGNAAGMGESEFLLRGPVTGSSVMRVPAW